MKDFDFKSPSLIVIDVQRYFFERGADAFLEESPTVLPNILKLIDAFGNARLPVIFTRHAHKRGSDTGQMGRWWDGKLPWEGSKEAEIIGDIVPKPGEIVITKTRYSAFEGTSLEKELKSRGVQTLVACGVMTNLCVETTVRHAFMKDFRIIVISDATAANTNRHHNASILNLSYGFALIENTNTIINQIGR